MPNCWTCGTNVSGFQYTCSSCKGLKEIQGLQKKVILYQEDISEKLDYMEQIQREGFQALTDTLSSGLLEIASAIEWGFAEISWQLQRCFFIASANFPYLAHITFK